MWRQLSKREPALSSYLQGQATRGAYWGRGSIQERAMLKACALGVLAAMFSGCVMPSTARREQIEWPGEDSTLPVAPSMEAGAALAAAAAIRELVETNTDPRLFRGCSSPEQGLNVSVSKDPKSGLYYVVLEQRFERCGGPSGRVLDWWHEYAVTAQGVVVAEAPLMEGEIPVPPSAPGPAAPEDAPPPGTPPPSTPSVDGDASMPTSPPTEQLAPDAPSSSPALTPPPTPEAAPGAESAARP